MVHPDRSSAQNTHTTVTGQRTSRRRFLGAGAAVATTGALSACGGFSTGGSKEDGGSSDDGSLTMITWASDAEAAAFKALADGFKEQTGTTVKLQVVPYSEVLTAVDTGLRTDTPPDLFRVSYTDVAAYRGQNVLASLPDADTLKASFLPAFWSAVTDEQGTFGIPHHTDTSMVVLNTAAVASAGLGTLPATLDAAWSWEDFAAALGRIKPSRADSYAFAANWQNAGAYRWLNFVDQAGGRLLSDDLTSVAADDPGALKALTYTRDLFRKQLTPQNASARGQAASDLFLNQTVATAFAGDFLLAEIDGGGFEYSATFLPRDVNASADLGGNALVAVEASEKKEQALKFLTFCAQAEQMGTFCAAASVLPTRSDVDPATLKYPVRPDLMELYVEQAKAIREPLVQQVVVPSFSAINAQLRDRLDEVFLGGDDDAAALKRITDGVASVLKQS
ncbi:ABC transporter substrate-binding protein [Kineococcus rhizosphaerae]|uniref:Multiple sugar transport system substrate-binding protein n=1 Tax=Kineococcus rhizosphaerae TaxID=559628 RepID=A0A2T0R3E8_9ACTN|nr:sugar ABC transporter substrate-binding protein [Kineococcus rhizosphaerae]PRY14587.1 multiple sugar transport system substrate-binding protein [Kineococcus rhizosphaerae]